MKNDRTISGSKIIPKPTPKNFLIILSSDQEYLPSTEQHYTPQEMIGKLPHLHNKCGETHEKFYPSFASRARTMEEAPADREKWVAVDNWIKQHQ